MIGHIVRGEALYVGAVGVHREEVALRDAAAVGGKDDAGVVRLPGGVTAGAGVERELSRLAAYRADNPDVCGGSVARLIDDLLRRHGNRWFWSRRRGCFGRRGRGITRRLCAGSAIVIGTGRSGNDEGASGGETKDTPEHHHILSGVLMPISVRARASTMRAASHRRRRADDSAGASASSTRHSV